MWNPAAMTREGVRIGSRLPDVLRTYGDTRDNLKMDATSDCLDIMIQADQGDRGSQTSYERPTMPFTYLDRGLGFDLNWAGTPGVLLVTTITVMYPTACRPLFGR